jgi:hypothetical protein
MRPLRYSSNVTLDGCCDHRDIPGDDGCSAFSLDGPTYCRIDLRIGYD